MFNLPHLLNILFEAVTLLETNHIVLQLAAQSCIKVAPFLTLGKLALEDRF